ncbi:MAG: hypothetical protein L0K54_09190 [Tetragenococcus koreensis]|nr:hypothetical protein [Tetragenococcus koreensis]MDN6749106.1 hypothetical protein [Staphylococcus equorum]MDN6270560.1 hypothetical protein [Tetragenococcus koreensis]MDN6497312.1 hypothetical protein [Tetragenococcus koreensis]MDN6502014.1 hypothetical protein [Tetragenococcus koreensis]
MESSRKARNLFIAILVAIFIAFLFVKWSDIQEMFTHNKAEQQRELISEEKQKNKRLNEQVTNLNNQVSNLENDLSEATDPNSNNEDKEKANKKLLTDLAENWTNFQSINERNQSVKEFLSEKAIEENGLDSNPHVEFDSEGKIEEIAKTDDESQQSYIVLVEETARGQERTLLIEAVIQDSKVNTFNANYIDDVEESE